jgi:AcrR family transcriptional regulator
MTIARSDNGLSAFPNSDALSKRLRPGPGGPDREQIVEVQRARLIAAAADAIVDVGYSRMSVAAIISRARVSRKTFYDLFEDRDACVLAMLDHAINHAQSLTADAYAEQADWRKGIRAALATLLTLLDQEPGLARLCLLETLGAGPQLRDRHAQVMRELAVVVDRGRELATSQTPVTDVTAEGVVGAIYMILQARLLGASGEPLLSLLNPLMSLVVLPYLGTRAARTELARPCAPAAQGRRPERRTDPLAGTSMRITYRTVRVLMVIADRAGANNREIACDAGITDQGQISKLLNRLAGHGLIENRGVGQPYGGSNAWFLTQRGVELERATRPLDPNVAAARGLLADMPGTAMREGSRSRGSRASRSRASATAAR